MDMDGLGWATVDYCRMGTRWNQNGIGMDLMGSVSATLVVSSVSVADISCQDLLQVLRAGSRRRSLSRLSHKAGIEHE